jgi:hypothetical protein
VDARAGVSSAVVVRGEPDIGKTSLLRWAAEQAGDMRILSARGVEFKASCSRQDWMTTKDGVSAAHIVDGEGSRIGSR